MKYIFKRKLYQRMLEWKKGKNGKTALLIEGPRRVGKSTLAETFAQNEYSSYIKVDFATAPKQVHQLFEDLSDIDNLLMQLQFFYHVVLKKRESVIIFDEVQKQPLARQAIKYLVADGRYDYIETGSLISIKKNVKDIVIPSEETKMTLNPLDYEEYRWALGDTATTTLLQRAFENRTPQGDVANRKLMRDFRQYMLIGGMPQAIEEYLNSNNLAMVDEVKRSIIELYIDDFRKVDPTGRLGKLFKAIPAQLNKNVARYQVSNVDSNLRPSEALSLIAEMEDSKTVNISYNVTDPNAGMSGMEDLNSFKLYTADTGIFITLAFMDNDFTENVIYTKLLSDKLSANLGYVYENIVSQLLKANGHKLFYYTFKSETSNHVYEIDFLIAKKHKICPIEVKSSGYNKHTSFDVFCDKYSQRISEKYIIYTKDLRREGDLTYLPVPMVMFL